MGTFASKTVLKVIDYVPCLFYRSYPQGVIVYTVKFDKIDGIHVSRNFENHLWNTRGLSSRRLIQFMWNIVHQDIISLICHW